MPLLARLPTSGVRLNLPTLDWHDSTWLKIRIVRTRTRWSRCGIGRQNCFSVKSVTVRRSTSGAVGKWVILSFYADRSQLFEWRTFECLNFIVGRVWNRLRSSHILDEFLVRIVDVFFSFLVAFWENYSRRSRCSSRIRNCFSWSWSAGCVAYHVRQCGRMSYVFRSSTPSSLANSTRVAFAMILLCKLLWMWCCGSTCHDKKLTILWSLWENILLTLWLPLSGDPAKKKFL